MLLKQYEKTSVVSMVCGMTFPLRWSKEESPVHLDIIDALETGNPDKAVKAVLNHIKAEDNFVKSESK